MADMPGKVLIDRRMHAWRPENWHLLDRREGQVLYTRVYEQAGEFDHQGIDPADLGQHFIDAMQALTARNAVSKAACAQLIAEQALRAEQAEATLAEMCDKAETFVQRAEQAEADRDTLGAHLERTQARARELESKVTDRRALTQWAVDLEAERDRLRVALERVRELAEDGKTSPCAMQVCEDIEMAAQEALSHD